MKELRQEETLKPTNKVRHGVRSVASFLFWSLLFGIAYTQPPLYYSNQNQYFLHGLAQAGHGNLNEDWLANTTDPTPIFSSLVAFTSRYLHETLFYVYFILLLGVYFHALVGIFSVICNRPPTFLMRVVFVTLLLALHSGLLRYGSAQLFGVDYPWYFQAGVANQYILGAGLQPSVFGVLLVLSVYMFLRDRPVLAVTWSSLGAVMHSTYLLAAALLTLSYLVILCRERRLRPALVTGLWALLIVLPVVVYNLSAFAPTTRETFTAAQRLLAHVRIPHHAEVERWLDAIAWVQIGWIILAMGLVRGNRLFVILCVTFTLSVLLTLVQIFTGNDTLALLFPWRISSILVPLSTAIILARLVNGIASFAQLSMEWRLRLGVLFALLLCFCGIEGAAINYFGLGYRTNEQELNLLEHIRENAAPGEVYLLPVEIPKRFFDTKGAASLNFTPPPRRSSQEQVISVDLQRFRLYTGAPIYIDFKSIPYKDEEILEWHRRLVWNEQLYKNPDWNRAEVVTELRRRSITHVIAARDRAVHCDVLRLVYEDESYRLYRLIPR